MTSASTSTSRLKTARSIAMRSGSTEADGVKLWHRHDADPDGDRGLLDPVEQLHAPLRRQLTSSPARRSMPLAAGVVPIPLMRGGRRPPRREARHRAASDLVYASDTTHPGAPESALPAEIGSRVRTRQTSARPSISNAHRSASNLRRGQYHAIERISEQLRLVGHSRSDETRPGHR